MNMDEAKKKIEDAFVQLFSISQSTAAQLLPAALTAGKAYEAYVLADVCEQLISKEGFNLKLRNGTKLVLKTSHGPINRNYPWIEVDRSGQVFGEIFTDIEFMAFSYTYSNATVPTPGSYHEVDIALVVPQTSGRPTHDQLLLVVECKNTTYNKGLLKEILGIRREMGLLNGINTTQFFSWPAVLLPVTPPSCLLVYSSSSAVTNFEAPGKTFGIQFVYYPM